jgi:hypothetical protein
VHGKFVERFVDGEQLILFGWGGDFHVVNIHALLPSAMPPRSFDAGAIDQNSPHGFGGRAKEVSPILEVRFIVAADEPKPRLMDKRSRLQSMAWRFRCHLVSRDAAQLLIDQRQQFTRGL